VVWLFVAWRIYGEHKSRSQMAKAAAGA
jgi:hypothetical protein